MEKHTAADRLLRLPQVLEVFPVGKSSWYAGIKAGRYPVGLKLGPHTTAWRMSDITRLIESASAK
jgi:prophage regulatory protein